ncbi:MAG: bifunctional DNA primase/polymerase [Planctomycetota bacterium]
MITTSNPASLLPSALAYRESGLSVLPAKRLAKRPSLPGWKNFQLRIPQERQVVEWFSKPEDAICVVTGQVSGNLEMLDFDRGGDRFEAWKEQIPPELLARLVIETSQSGGKHVIYRCSEPINGNMKLAMGFRDGAMVTLIETRGEGGLFLCAPTLGYSLEQGSLTEIPVLTPQEREILLETAWSLNEYLPTADVPADSQFVPENRPGDDFNNRGDIRALLIKHGWTLVKKAENELWRRPGKANGWSASLKDKSFYVFSGNAAPLEPNRAYSPFAVYAWLEYGGDFEMAARVLRQQGYGGDPMGATIIQLHEPNEFVTEPRSKNELVDPGPVPLEMLRIPGFVSEVMDLCLATAPYPNHVMAFSGALALQAFLAGRKVRDPGDNRTNLYLLGLAHSAAGKDWPRKLNTRILFEIGAAGSLGERFSSGEGIQDALYLSPSMLFQTDEIDGMLQSMSKSKDGRHENLMSTLLTMYSTANSVYPMRRKAGKESPGAIDQPCLVVFGTAIPNHYYEALSERMLTNGFFARMIILECGVRGAGQEAKVLEIPERVVATAKWWKDLMPGQGNLQSWHPIPTIVPQTAEAVDILADTRVAAETEYRNAESQNDAVGTTVWGRVNEQARKLALLYAISENHADPIIGAAAANWATSLMMHQTRRMLFMAGNHVAENPYHADCLRLIRKLQLAPDRQMSHSMLLKRMKMNAKAFQEIITTLEQQGDIEPVSGTTQGRAGRGYRLVKDWSDQ